MSKPAVYSEEQARHWLWFLAHNMQRHGQSMFMLEQLEPSWLLTQWQVFFYLLLSRTVMFGTLAVLIWCGTIFVFLKASDVALGFVGLVATIGAVSVIVGLVWALLLFLRTSDRLPEWFRSLFRALMMVFFFLFRVFVWPVQWALERNGRTLKDDIQPVERLSWSWMNFLKGFLFLTIKPPLRNFALLNFFFSFIFWSARILWFAFLVLIALGTIQDIPARNVDHANDFIFLLLVILPNLFCAFFSAIRGSAVELKTAPNLGILLSGRNALITIAVNFVLALIAKLIYRQSYLRNEDLFALVPEAIIIAGAIAWGRLGGLDYLAHYCLRFVLRRRGYIPRDYVRFLNYASTELGFLQKVGGGYVFMHRYLLEYFAGSEQSSSGAADFSAGRSAAAD